MPRVPRFVALAGLTAALGTLLAIGPQPAFATEHEAEVDDVTVALAPVQVPAGDGSEATVTRLVGGDDDVEAFTMIGATYAAADPGAGRIRALVDGGWSRWFPVTELEAENDHGPDAGTDEAAHETPASEPIWFGDATGFQLSLPGDAADLSVHLVRETSHTVVVDGTDDAEGYTIP